MNTAETQFDFDQMASRYDRCNHLFSFGIDHLWRRRLVRAACPKIQQRVLDLCCGTGDVVFSFLKHSSTQHVTGLDISEPMIELARQKQQKYAKKVWLRNKTIDWKVGNAAQIDLPDQSIDFVTCAFGIRNVTDRRSMLKEASRLLKPRGRVLVLEFSLPANPVLRIFYWGYLRFIMPLAGRWVLGSSSPLRYLAQSIRHWQNKVNFNAEIAESGLCLVRKVPLCCGIAALWVIRKA